MLENSLLSAREAGGASWPSAPAARQVQVIGNKFVLYRQSHKKGKTDKIVLVQPKQKKR